MSAHTPGPWTVGNRVNCFIDIYHSFGNVKGAITHALCRVQSRDSWVAESEANARLIAAAPDLLSALKHLEAVADLSLDYRPEFRSAIADAHAAIAKAEAV